MDLITLIYFLSAVVGISGLVFLVVSYILYKKKKKETAKDLNQIIDNKKIEKEIEHLQKFTIEKELPKENSQTKSPFQKIDNLEQKKKNDIKFN
ncbi:MAG TPA: hypothetical protein PLI27_08500 [Ignavibacteriales bacterium]|nr:hypothetical protein [Ignavibacteriales bacterium]HOL81211.1 hypothetical protein [Ignavibacteriales bacterium]HOM65314.1 hypothetical protein [Ignavibacteriales bacterium]HPD68098.1 hypothetical protein [Ignavibacteriales bacterium]HPP33433.1 hypothetical protein [Ignavibacteriales bacterium]